MNGNLPNIMDEIPVHPVQAGRERDQEHSPQQVDLKGDLSKSRPREADEFVDEIIQRVGCNLTFTDKTMSAG